MHSALVHIRITECLICCESCCFFYSDPCPPDSGITSSLSPSPSLSPSHPSSSSSLATWTLIVAITVPCAVLLVLVLVIALAMYFVWRMKSDKVDKVDFPPHQMECKSENSPCHVPYLNVQDVAYKQHSLVHAMHNLMYIVLYYTCIIWLGLHVCLPNSCIAK